MRKITLITLIVFAGLLSAEVLVTVAEVKKTLLPVPLPVAVQTERTGQQPLPIIAQPSESTYSYNPVGKPDPFRPFMDEEITAKKKEGKKDVSSIFPLQRAEVDQFRLVGITGDKSRWVAIVVEDATKKHYPLFVGTHIGIHRGKVVEILPDRVIVEEYETKKAKRIILKLHKN
jgi:Tfp pilus assembly protein PilP